MVDSTPDDPFETSVYRGLAIVTHTRDSLPALRRQHAELHELPSRRRAPAERRAARRRLRALSRNSWIARGAVVPIEDRVNYCFTRSLAGSKLPPDSREMQDIVAYLAFISKGVPYGEHVRGEGMPKMPALAGDSARGRPLFAENCARCHGGDGRGHGTDSCRCGARSRSASARRWRGQERAASFIRHNMPFDAPGTLTDQQAFDVAAYMTSMPRPDSPGKENDWPDGGAPADVPYDTKGTRRFRPPRAAAAHDESRRGDRRPRPRPCCVARSQRSIIREYS